MFRVLACHIVDVVLHGVGLGATRLLRQVWHLTLPLCGWNAAGHYARRIMHDAGSRRGLEARSGIAHLAQHAASSSGIFSSPQHAWSAGRLASSEQLCGKHNGPSVTRLTMSKSVANKTGTQQQITYYDITSYMSI